MGTDKFLDEQFPPVRTTGEVATALDKPLVAIVDYDGTVSMWDLVAERKLIQFHSNWDIGGHRLAVSREGNMCAVGAYQRYGVTLHDTSDGSVVWTRKDLKKVQNLKFGAKKDFVLAGIDERAFHIIEASSGKDVKTVRGATELWENPFGSQFFSEMRSKNHEIIDFENPDRRNVIKRSASGVLDVAFGPDHIAVSEVAGPTTVYALDDKKVIWKNSEPGSHDDRLSFCGNTDELIAINGKFKDSQTSIVAFDAMTGKINRRFVRNDLVNSCFAINGTRVVTSHGNVVDTLTGETVSQLGFR